MGIPVQTEVDEMSKQFLKLVRKDKEIMTVEERIALALKAAQPKCATHNVRGIWIKVTPMKNDYTGKNRVDFEISFYKEIKDAQFYKVINNHYDSTDEQEHANKLVLAMHDKKNVKQSAEAIAHWAKTTNSINFTDDQFKEEERQEIAIETLVSQDVFNVHYRKYKKAMQIAESLDEILDTSDLEKHMGYVADSRELIEIENQFSAVVKRWEKALEVKFDDKHRKILNQMWDGVRHADEETVNSLSNKPKKG